LAGVSASEHLALAHPVAAGRPPNQRRGGITHECGAVRRCVLQDVRLAHRPRGGTTSPTSTRIEARIAPFERRYEQTAAPFEWRFTGDDLTLLMKKLADRPDHPPHDTTRVRDRSYGPEQLLRHRRIGQPLSSSRCLLSGLALFRLRYSEGLSPVICLKTRRNAEESP